MLERMVFYGQTGHCRWKVLLENFGEAEGFGACGTCDNCIRIAAAFAAAERERERPTTRPKASGRAATHRRRRRCPRAASSSRCRATAAASSTRSMPKGVTVVFAEGERRVFLPRLRAARRPAGARRAARKSYRKRCLSARLRALRQRPSKSAAVRGESGP